MSEDLPVLNAWSDFLDWFFDTLDRFPKKVRFTLTTRLLNLSLDVLEDLIDAKYTSKQEKVLLLNAANRKIEKLRVLSRLCLKKQIFQPRDYERMAKELQFAGAQVGGWLKEAKQKI
ncbi:MAG: diversity-generating retroelement protein Avd [Candidatus Brocadiae bacterium]|nr:diversity-generating retroelement protein Avd [Candidatus Brocadiia bacterium]